MLRIPSPKGEGFTDPQKGTLKTDLAWISTANDSPNAGIAKRFIGLKISAPNVIEIGELIGQLHSVTCFS